MANQMGPNENMMFTRHSCNKHFLRKVLLGLEDKLEGCSRCIDTVGFIEDKPITVWMAGGDFSVLLFRQVFKNKDDSGR